MENTSVIESAKTACLKNRHVPAKLIPSAKSDWVLRNKIFHVSFSENELECLSEKMKALGITQSDLIRGLVRGFLLSRPYLVPGEVAALRECCLALSRLSASLIETGRLVGAAAQTGCIELDCKVLETEFPEAIKSALKARDEILGIVNQAESRILFARGGS